MSLPCSFKFSAFRCEVISTKKATMSFFLSSYKNWENGVALALPLHQESDFPSDGQEALQHTAFAEPSYIEQQKVISTSIKEFPEYAMLMGRIGWRMPWEIESFWSACSSPQDSHPTGGSTGSMDELCKGKRLPQDCPISFMPQLISLHLWLLKPLDSARFPSLWTSHLWPGRCPHLLYWSEGVHHITKLFLLLLEEPHVN